MEEQKHNVAILSRLALFLEREARFIGIDIEPGITLVLHKLKEKKNVKTD